nr:type VII secretion integral membrane protein EccD [Sphaerisporangium rubeum]
MEPSGPATNPAIPAAAGPPVVQPPPAQGGGTPVAVLRGPGTGVALTRVTVVTPRKRVDLAVPSDLPLAHVLPGMLGAAGETGDDPAYVSSGWVLQRVGGRPLDVDSGLGSLGVRDGEVLYLVPRASELPEAVFDDVADTIATAVKERAGRWRERHTRATGLGAAIAFLLAGALALTVAGPPWQPAAIVCGVAALLLTGGAAALSRAFGDAGAGAAIGYTALPYAFLAGMFAPARDVGLLWFGAPSVLAGFAMTALAATVAGWAVAEGLPGYFGVVVASLAGAAGSAAVMVWDVPVPGAAAAVATVVLACTPLIPALSFRLARLPLPAAPANAEELRADTGELDGPDVKRRAVEAERFATGLTAGVALVAFAGEVLLLGADGWAARATHVVLALALLVRARVFLGVGQRLWLIAAGTAGLVLFLVAVGLTGQKAALLIAPALLVAGAVATGAGLFLSTERPTPFWGRAGDVLEFVLVMALFPLTLAVLDVYSWVRGLAG